MARELRDMFNNKEDYPDKCYLYGADSVKNSEISKDAQPLARFYKKDLEPFAWKRLDLGGGQLSSSVHFIGVVETLDHVEMLRPDMYVIDQTGMLFTIVEPVISDDYDRTKRVGKRPIVKTTFTLRGIEKR